MKIKLSVLTFTLLFLTFGCAEFEDRLGVEPTLPPPPPQQYTNPLTGGTTFPTQLKLTNYTALTTDLKSAVTTINSNTSAYWSTLADGQQYTNFTSVWPNQAKYISRVHMIAPPAGYVPMTEANFKAYINTELPKLGMSSEFSRYVNSSVNWIYERLVRNVGTVVWSSTAFGVYAFKNYFEGQMYQVSRSTLLSEFEKFVLTQMYNAILLQTTHAYYNPSPTLYTSGCLPSTKEEWKAVGQAAALTGLSWGVRYGIAGVRAGAIATTAAGNPIAGGIIGGGLGFILGFGAGAFLGGGGKLMINCIWNKVAGQLMTFQCGDKIYTGWTASPPTGCTEITPLMSSIPQAIKVSLTSIYEYGVVPNQGNFAIPSSVTTSVNDFLKYLNK